MELEGKLVVKVATEAGVRRFEMPGHAWSHEEGDLDEGCLMRHLDFPEAGVVVALEDGGAAFYPIRFDDPELEVQIVSNTLRVPRRFLSLDPEMDV